MSKIFYDATHRKYFNCVRRNILSHNCSQIYLLITSVNFLTLSLVNDIEMFHKHSSIHLLFSILATLNYYSCQENGVCDAGALICKPTVTSKNVGKLIRRWMDKLKKNPSCFTGPDAPSFHDVDKNIIEVVRVRDGLKHGLCLRYLDSDQRYLAGVTMYDHGVETGPDWDLTMGRGHNSSYHFRSLSNSVSRVPDLESPMNMFGGGALVSRELWLYPDMETVMVGAWSQDGVMLHGQQGTINSVTCREGMMELDVRVREHSLQYKYDSATGKRISSHPRRQDIYEAMNVRTQISRWNV